MSDYMPTPPAETETALVRLPPKRPRSSPSPEPRGTALSKRPKPHSSSSNHGHQPLNPNTKKKHTPSTEEDRTHFFRTLATLTSIPPAKSNLLQLQQIFLSSYFSMGVITSHRQYFAIFYWLSPSSAAMNASRDALCMLHIGARSRNVDLVREGQRRHITAIRCLREDLGRPGAVNDDAVLGAQYTLGQSQVFMAVSGWDPSWMTHVNGLQQLLLSRGPESMTSPFARALVYNLRPLSVVQGIMSRRSSLMGEKAWMEAAREGWQGKVMISVELTDLSLQIPGLLERADGLAERAKGKGKKKESEALQMEIVALLTELSALENEIQKWLLKFYRLTQAEQSPYRLSNIANYPFLRTGCGGLAHVFPSMIEFPAFMSATTHVWVWTCLLVVRETILDVAALHPYPIVRARDQEASLKASVDECAVNLCQTIGYLIHPDHASCGILACSSALHFSALWFEKRGHTQRLIWARHVREFLQRDVLHGGAFDTSLNINRPMFVWWMLPEIVADEDAEGGAADKVIEESEGAKD